VIAIKKHVPCIVFVLFSVMFLTGNVLAIMASSEASSRALLKEEQIKRAKVQCVVDHIGDPSYCDFWAEKHKDEF